MNTSTLAPICLFVYSRLPETRQLIESLHQNPLAAQSQLFIFSDGAKSEKVQKEVADVREYIHSVTGFSKVTVIESPVNKGLANSVIAGVTQIVSEFGKVIVLEDDLILSTNFLDFMNEALDYYQDKKKVLNVSGYSFTLKYPAGYNSDVAFSYRFASWGWAIWKDRWEQIDWEVKDYPSFKRNIIGILKFSRGGSDMCTMLSRQMKGKIDSWAIRFDYHHYKYGYLDVFPVVSKVKYNGFNTEATHTTEKCDTYDTVLDTSGKQTFSFSDELRINKRIALQFYKHYSFTSRLKDKISQWSWKRK